MNALYATAHAESWFALVTLNSPTRARIDTWPELLRHLTVLKQTLTNWHRRKDFPAMLLVTEFDPPGTAQVSAHFHIVFAETLSKDQVWLFQRFWLEFNGTPNNQGRIFDYQARGGGMRLTRYLAKDFKVKDLVKYAAPWMPKRSECRLWFTIGLKHKPAKEGAALRANGHPRRRKYNASKSGSRASRGGDLSQFQQGFHRSDSAHASPYKTAVPHSANRRLVHPQVGEWTVSAKGKITFLSRTASVVTSRLAQQFLDRSFGSVSARGPPY